VCQVLAVLAVVVVLNAPEAHVHHTPALSWAVPQVGDGKPSPVHVVTRQGIVNDAKSEPF